MAKFFQIRDADGVVLKVLNMSQADAQLNLTPGTSLKAFDANVAPSRQTWTGTVWEDLPPEPSPEDDYEFMRATGYPPVGDQLDAIVKLLANPNNLAAQAQFADIVFQIQEVKDAYPIVGGGGDEEPPAP